MRPPFPLAPCYLLSLGIGLSPVAHDLSTIVNGDCLSVPVTRLRGTYQVSCENDMISIRPLSGPFLGELERFIIQFYSGTDLLLSLPEADEEAIIPLAQWNELWTKMPAAIVFIDTAS